MTSVGTVPAEEICCAQYGLFQVVKPFPCCRNRKLTAEGCSLIRSEKVSGGSRDGRAELATIIAFLHPGDELVVTRLDRLGRDTRDVLNLIHEAEQNGAFVTVLDPHVSTRGEMGHVVLTVLGMVAQMATLYQRAAAGGDITGEGRRRLRRRKAKARS